MPTVKNVGEPCARKPHARFEVAAGGNQASRLRRAAQAPLADPTATWPHGAAPFRRSRASAPATALRGSKRDDYIGFPFESHPLNALFGPIPVVLQR
jgi:hypothetical protein